MVELIALFTLAAIAVMVIGCLAVGLAMLKLFVWLVLLPFRLALYLFVLPFVLLGAALKLLFGLLLLPVLAIGAVIALLGLALALVIPLLVPLLFLAFFVWVIVKLASRPTTPAVTVRN